MGASLVALAARAAPEWADGPGVATQAARLGERLLALADEDAAAFATALEVMRSARGTPDADRVIGDALARAADVPLTIAEAASDVAALARLAAEHGRASVAPDANAARELAEAAVRAAAALVHANLTTRPDDDRARRAALAVTSCAG
jgi:formiminotetrahydrofolate cyclodeaminase